jgi:hypothetical protein
MCLYRKRAVDGGADGGKERKAGKSEGDGQTGVGKVWKGKLSKKMEPEIAHNHKEQRELKKKRQVSSDHDQNTPRGCTGHKVVTMARSTFVPCVRQGVIKKFLLFSGVG